MTAILEWLYPLTGVMFSLMFLPQIVKLHKCKQARSGVSLLTWGAWSVGSLITLLYASANLGDRGFTLVSFCNFIGTIVVFYYGVHDRFERRWWFRTHTSEKKM